MTKEAFENAIAVVMALGGSTNAVLHLLAIAHEARVELELDDFNRIGDRVPHLADMKPHGTYHMTDLDRIGGVPVVMKALLDAGLLHGDCLTVTGKTMAENLADLAPPDPDGEIVHATATPIHRTGGLLDPPRLAGARRRGGEVGRRRRSPSSKVRPRSSTTRSTRWTQSSRDDRARRRRRDPLRGPEGGPGDARDARDHRRDEGRRARRGRRCSSPTAGSRAATAGFCVGHVAPEAVDGGPIAFVADGDRDPRRLRRPHASTCWSTTPSWSAGGPAGSRREPRYTTRRPRASTPGSSGRRPAERSATDARRLADSHAETRVSHCLTLPAARCDRTSMRTGIVVLVERAG